MPETIELVIHRFGSQLAFQLITSKFNSKLAHVQFGCGKTITLDSPKMPGGRKYEINVRAVWGQMVTGGGGSPLQEQCATMGMPSMTRSAFSSMEEQIGCWWKHTLFCVCIPVARISSSHMGRLSIKLSGQ